MNVTGLHCCRCKGVIVVSRSCIPRHIRDVLIKIGVRHSSLFWCRECHRVYGAPQGIDTGYPVVPICEQDQYIIDSYND
jgi:hypothetical protein